MVTALAVFVPTFFLGIPSGHDFEFHLNSWMEVLSQWRLGILYPALGGLAHFGYGEARFIFYPPASWMLGAALGSFLPWRIVPGVYQWIALTLAGCSMFLLARRFMARRDATFAAALYAANPYHIVIVYWRSAFAELLVSALLPLLLLVLLRSGEEQSQNRSLSEPDRGRRLADQRPGRGDVDLLSGVCWWSLSQFCAVRRALLCIGAGGAPVGLALAAFYVVPVLYEQKWVEIAQVLSPGVRPQDNFIFTSLNNPDHDRFNLLISVVSVAEMIFWP